MCLATCEFYSVQPVVQKVSIHPCDKDNATGRIHFEFSNNES